VNPKRCLAIILSLGHTAFALAQPVPQTPALPVTADNYNRAQTDIYFGQTVKAGALGRFRHGRELAPIVFRPYAEVLNAKWKFPEAQLVN